MTREGDIYSVYSNRKHACVCVCAQARMRMHEYADVVTITGTWYAIAKLPKNGNENPFASKC